MTVVLEKLLTGAFAAGAAACAVGAVVLRTDSLAAVVCGALSGILAVLAGQAAHYWWLNRRDERRHEAEMARMKAETLRAIDRALGPPTRAGAVTPGTSCGAGIDRTA